VVIPVVLVRTRTKTSRSGYRESNLWRDTHSFSPFPAMDRMSGVVGVVKKKFFCEEMMLLG
jgi:hypothetical protein